MNKNNIFLDIFFQDYSQEDIKIPSHWCVKYCNEELGVQYSYHTEREEGVAWAKDNTNYRGLDLLSQQFFFGITEEDDDIELLFEDTKHQTTLGFGQPVQDREEEVVSSYGATPPITPEFAGVEFPVKVYNTIRDSRQVKLDEYFPEWVEELSHIDGVYLAGGVLRSFIRKGDKVCDIDLFFRDMDALDAAMKFMGRIDDEYYEAFRCPMKELITYKSVIDKPLEHITDEDYANQRKIQFITKSFYESPEELISTFDFINTCACMYKDVLYTHRDWLRHNKKGTLGLNFVSYPVATLSRFARYKEKGFFTSADFLVELFTQLNTLEYPEGQLALYVD